MSVDPNWHHMMAVEGIGYGHNNIASIGQDWWSITVEVIDPPSKALSASSIYNQSYKKYKSLSKPSSTVDTQIVRVTIRYKGEIVSQRDYIRTVGKAIIKVAPVIQKAFNALVRFKSNMKSVFKIKVKPK